MEGNWGCFLNAKHRPTYSVLSVGIDMYRPTYFQPRDEVGLHQTLRKRGSLEVTKFIGLLVTHKNVSRPRPNK